MRKAALIAFVLGALSLSLMLVATQPSHLSPDSGPPAIYTGVRPDWVRVLPLPSASPSATIQPAPATPTEPPLATPSPVEPPPTVEAPPPTETITIASVATPVEVPASPTAAPSVESSPPPTESPPPPATAVAEALDLAYADAIVELTNEVRVANGLNPLTQHPALVAAAQEYAELHVQISPDRLDHRLNGSTLASRAETEGYAGWSLLAENLFWGSSEPPLPAAQAVDLWLASPSHRENLLNPALTEIGVGCCMSAAQQPFRICAQEFGARP